MKRLTDHLHILLAVLLAAALPLCLDSGTLASELLIFAMAAVACSLLLGQTGLMSFGQGIFYGMGSYGAGLLLLHLHVALPLALGGAVLAGALAATLVGWFSIRQRGVYFVMLTLAFSQLFFFLAYSLKDVTGGDNGLLDIPRPPLEAFGLVLLDTRGPWAYYALIAVVFVLVFAAAQRLSTSMFGRTLLAIRDNEARALAVGYDVRRFKLAAFVIAGAATGLAGGLHAMLVGLAPLSNIEYHLSETILLMTVIGGTRHLFAAVVGAAFYVLVADWMSAIWPRWMMLFGFLLVAVTLYMPQGLWGAAERLVARVRASRTPAVTHDASVSRGDPA